MSDSIRERLEEAIGEEDRRTRSRLEESHERARGAEQAFAPVRQAVEEVREQLEALPSIEFAINPDSVWITLADRELTVSYDPHTGRFIGEERAHAWYDGEPYAEIYEWDGAEACIDAVIRLCARYVRMVRAITAAGTAG